MNNPPDLALDESREHTAKMDAIVNNDSGISSPNSHHDLPVHDSEYSSNYVREQFYWLKPASDLGIVAVMLVIEVLGFVFGKIYTSLVLSSGITILVALTLLYAFRAIWIWKNWTYEINPFKNSVTLYMPGFRWLFVREHGAATIPMLGTSVTEFNQSWIE